MTTRQDLDMLRRYFKGFSRGNSGDRDLWEALKRVEDRMNGLDALLKECAVDPGAMPTPEGYALVLKLKSNR